MLSLLVRGIQNALDGRHEAGDELHAGENVQVVPFSFSSSVAGVVHVCTPAQPSILSGGCVVTLRGSLGDRAVLTVDQEIRRAELALARFVIVGACKLRGLLLELRPISVICIATYVAILEAHGGCEPTGASHGTG